MSQSRSYKHRERRRSRLSPRFAGLSAIAFAAIAYATLCPIELRPHLGPANVERYFAFVALGYLLAMTFRRNGWLAAGAVVFIAVGLEAGQLFISGRHAQVADGVVKVAGGLSGAVAGYASFPLLRLLARNGAAVESQPSAAKARA